VEHINCLFPSEKKFLKKYIDMFYAEIIQITDEYGRVIYEKHG